MQSSTKKHLTGHLVILVLCFGIALFTTEGGSFASLAGLAVGYWLVPGLIWLVIASLVLKDKKIK